jgi:hypothetical protein
MLTYTVQKPGAVTASFMGKPAKERVVHWSTRVRRTMIA